MRTINLALLMGTFVVAGVGLTFVAADQNWLALFLLLSMILMHVVRHGSGHHGRHQADGGHAHGEAA